MGPGEGKWAGNPPDPRLEQPVLGQMGRLCVSSRWERGWREQLPCWEPGTAASGGGNRAKTCAGNSAGAGTACCGFPTPSGTHRGAIRCEVGAMAVVPALGRAERGALRERCLHAAGARGRVTHGGGGQQSFSRHAAKSRSAGTLRQLNPDFLSQLPVPRPQGLGNSRAPAAGHKSTLSHSNCTSSSCLK